MCQVGDSYAGQRRLSDIFNSVHLIFVLRQDLARYSWLSWDLGSVEKAGSGLTEIACICLPSFGIKGMHCHADLPYFLRQGLSVSLEVMVLTRLDGQ